MTQAENTLDQELDEDADQPPVEVLEDTRESRLALSRIPRGGKLARPAPAAGAHVAQDPLRPLAGESDLQHRRFLAWVASNASGGARSVSAVARAEGISEASLREVAQKYRWRARASAADQLAVERELSEGMAIQRRSVVRQVALAERVDGLLAVALDRLEAMLDKAEPTDDDVLNQVNRTLDLIKTAQRSQALMRTAVGLPNSTTRNEVAVAIFDAGKKSADDNIWEYATDEELKLNEAHEKMVNRLRERAAQGAPKQWEQP